MYVFCALARLNTFVSSGHRQSCSAAILKQCVIYSMQSAGQAVIGTGVQGAKHTKWDRAQPGSEQAAKRREAVRVCPFQIEEGGCQGYCQAYLQSYALPADSI